MLVLKDTLNKVITHINNQTEIALDCETTGKYPYNGDRLFSFAIATKKDAFYFNFRTEGLEVQAEMEDTFLDRSLIPEILPDFRKIIYIHNAKFDWAMVEREGMNIANAKIICTQVGARIDFNDHMKLSLDYLGEKIGYPKSDAVKEYCNKNKLFEYVHRPGKKKREKKYFFYKVPLEVVQPYAELDARICLHLGQGQLKNIHKQVTLTPHTIPKLDQVLNNERKLTKVLYRMEKRGVKIDKNFVMDAYNYEKDQVDICMRKFNKATGREFKDSNKLFSEVFTEIGEVYPTTAKGNPSFTDSALSKMTSPMAGLIRRYRKHATRAGTYESLLYFADDEDVLHASAKQAGTVTGRMSYSNPPMQCMEKVESDDPAYGDKFLIRRAFIPRPGYKLFMLDFDQFEYRMMLNYAEEMDLIKKINEGLDVHSATGEMVGVSRSHAKTVNFSLLYGSGIEALAASLGLDLMAARATRDNYFSTLPNVGKLIKRLHKQVSFRGYITNWFGRKYTMEPKFAYKAPNYLIQGGTADWIKLAMVNIDTLLKNYKSAMLLQVHDELLFEIHESEEHLVPIIKNMMENVTDEHPHVHLKYTVGVDCSAKSWQDKQEWKQ